MVWAAEVASLVTVTDTPGTTAPLVSKIFPEIWPVFNWAVNVKPAHKSAIASLSTGMTPSYCESVYMQGSRLYGIRIWA